MPFVHSPQFEVGGQFQIELTEDLVVERDVFTEFREGDVVFDGWETLHEHGPVVERFLERLLRAFGVGGVHELFGFEQESTRVDRLGCLLQFAPHPPVLEVHLLPIGAGVGELDFFQLVQAFRDVAGSGAVGVARLGRDFERRDEHFLERFENRHLLGGSAFGFGRVDRLALLVG